MNFGNVGASELLVVLFFGFVFTVLPFLVAIWLIINVRRMRRQLAALTARLDSDDRSDS